jgi:hypothetical protein
MHLASLFWRMGAHGVIIFAPTDEFYHALLALLSTITA